MQGLPYRNLSDEDIYSIIAYLRHQPAVTNQVGGDQPNILFALFAGAGLVPDPGPSRGPVQAVTKDTSPEYGQYLVSAAGCHDCHGANLTGGSGGLTPAGPNIVVLTANWEPEGFIQTMRTGVDPTGYRLSTVMPWKSYGKLDDVELAAIFAYLQSLK
jgi:mono/diheme cytochrome c family protein